MNKVKKQHYVPQFYLENFTDSKNNVYAFDIIECKSFKTTTENVAHQKYFYDYEPLDQFVGREQVIEKALAHSEAEWATVFRKLIAALNSRNINTLSTEDYTKLADYICTQQKRTPENRTKGIQLAKEVERQLRAKGATDNFIKESGLEADKFDAHFQQVYGLLSAGVLEEIEDLCNRQWNFWINKTKHNFYTSDHPVVAELYEEENWKGYEIYFPITPKYAVSIFTKKKPEISPHQKKVFTLDNPENVKFYNSLILVQCNRQIYSTENDFRLAEKIIKETPALRDPNRQRIGRM